MRQLTKCGDLQNNHSHMLTVKCGLWSWLPGRSILPLSESTKNPQKSCWLGQFQWPQGSCQQKQQTHLPGWPLPLGLHFQFMSIHKQNQHLQDNIFNMSLSFQRNCQRLPLPKLLHLDWTGLQGFPPSPLFSAISSQSPCPPSWCSQWPTKQVPLPGISLPLPSAFPNSTPSKCLPDLFYQSQTIWQWCFCLSLHSAHQTLTITD